MGGAAHRGLRSSGSCFGRGWSSRDRCLEGAGWEPSQRPASQLRDRRCQQSPSSSCPHHPSDHLPGLGPPRRFTGKIKTLQTFLLSSSLPLTPSDMHAGTSGTGACWLQNHRITE